MRDVANVLVLTGILVTGGALTVSAIAKVRESAARSECAGNLRQIGLSLANYHATNGRFPPAAEANRDLPPQRRLSWLVSIGPYSEGNPFWRKIDHEKAWDAEENRFAALTPMKLFQCPAYPDGPPVSTLAPTHYLGIAGLGPDAASLPLKDLQAGFLGYERTLRLSDIKNGISTVLVALETAAASGAWTAGGPPTVRGLDPSHLPYLGRPGQFGGLHHDGANALFADGSVRFLQESVRPEVLEAMATLASANKAGQMGKE
jgi:prepilin-type processing-associated H-X9-DG protein